MISRLPRWVWLGGAMLAFVAGMVNTVALLGFDHQGISHLTGTTTLLSASMASDMRGALRPLALILSFVLGAVLSGYIIRDSVLRLGHHYGATLVIESLLLFAAIPFLRRGSLVGECLACGACGLQNAMATNYSGAILRTTHMTGMFTDVGMLLGQKMGGVSVDMRRLKLCVLVVVGFVVGGTVGALLFPSWGYGTLIIPALLTGLAGGIYNSFLLFPSSRDKGDRA